MPAVIPASLLNIKIHSVTNLALGAICFIFQIAGLANSPHDVYEQIGIGFWGGLIIMLTALTAYKASTGEAQFLLGCSFVLSVLSFIICFSIMCIFAASIDEMKRYSSNPCTGYFTIPPKTPDEQVTFVIPPCSYYNSAHLAFDSILLICGLIGIPVNAFLTMGVITVYNPSPVAAGAA